MVNRNLLTKLFTFLIVVIPLIYWQGYYEGPKIFWFWGTSIVLTIFWIIRIVIYKKAIFLKSSDYWYLGWLLVLTISSLIGIHPQNSIIGGSYRHQGVLFFTGLWLSVKTFGLLSAKEKAFFYKCFTAVILAEVVILFVQFLIGMVYFGSPLGTIGEANAVGGFIAMGSFFVIKRMDRIFYGLPAIALLMTESRAALLALLPNLFLLFSALNKKLKTLGVIFITIFVFSFLITITPLTNSSTVENRLVIWKYALEQIGDRPILGFGAETGEAIYIKAFENHDVKLEGIIVDRAHNLFLDVLLWSGIVGLILFTCFLISSFIAIKNTSKKLLLFSLIIYSLFQPLSVVHFLFLIVL
jgi:hypothetical protein